MLKQLYIHNFTLIDTLDVTFHHGFSVITGETGAGKSIVLGAISLLLGQRADSKTIKSGTDKCIVEAHFDVSSYPDIQSFFIDNDIEYDATDSIIRRELFISGKSRSFINDTPVSLSLLKELGEKLIDIHSQHQNLLLNKQEFQLNVIDIIAKDKAPLNEYKDAYSAYSQALDTFSRLKEEIEQNQQNLEFIQYQYDELQNANLVDGELEEIEQQSETMSHSEDIKTALFDADKYLHQEGCGILPALKSVSTVLSDIVQVYPVVSEWLPRIETCQIELKDIAQELGHQTDLIDFNPIELDAINARIDTLHRLLKKYKVEHVLNLTELRQSLKEKLEHVENSEAALEQAQQDVNQLLKACQEKADRLTKLRLNAASLIEKQMHERLVQLGMPHLRFKVSVSTDAIGRNGQDNISFLFSANTSTPLQPISQVASGGEIARVMLSLKALIGGAMKLPTIIFDEIDTGVSGKMAEMMAKMMQEMGENNCQVISITHLPQIAALGQTHYRVSKTETPHGTVSNMQQLSNEERVTEIAQMLSGTDISEAAIQNAKELLRI